MNSANNATGSEKIQIFYFVLINNFESLKVEYIRWHVATPELLRPG
jgi:hypothetical protein